MSKMPEGFPHDTPEAAGNHRARQFQPPAPRLRGLDPDLKPLLEQMMIGNRLAESGRQRLAADLLQIIAGEQLVTYEGRDGSPAWQQLPDLAEKCLEAAGKVYPAIDQSADPAFHEILRQNAVMEGVIERLDTDVEARRARWGGLDKVPINPGGHFMPLGAIGRDPEGYFQSAPPPVPLADSIPPPPAAVEGAEAVFEPVINPEWTPPFASFDREKGAHPRCGAVHGAHVCARPAGHPGSHESESGQIGWIEEHEFPGLGRELHEHGKRVAQDSADDRLYDEEKF